MTLLNITLNKSKLALSITLALALTGCASIIEPEVPLEQAPLSAGDSYLKQDELITNPENVKAVDNDVAKSEFTRLNKDAKYDGATLEVDLSKHFTSDETFKFSTNELPFNDFLHYVLGELLQVSYLIEPSIKNITTPVTLELKEPVTAQGLFQLVQRVLIQNDTRIMLNDDVFYLYPMTRKGAKSDRAFGFGRLEQDVPMVSGDINQLIPLKYQIAKGLKRTLSNLVDAIIDIDHEQGLVFVQGNREQVLRTISLLEILDSPLLHKKSTALLSFAYIDSYTFIEKISELLLQDGIDVNIGSSSGASSVNFIPLEHLGKVVVFATDDNILDRIEYWSQLIDKPASGSEQSYYLYHPKYARASDLGKSLAPLLVSSKNSFDYSTSSSGINGQAGNTTTSPVGGIVAGGAAAQNKKAQLTKTVEGDNLRMVVDERANALIFYSTGKHFQELQPIIKQLDIMPKQVMLEVVIAEVKLTGSFAKGVQFALTNGSSTSKDSTFSFSSEGGFNYSIVGLPGNFNVNLSQTDGLINVLSKPTLVVRDGVMASISVGDDIPTIGSTTSDPINGERETTSIVYRKTGVDLSVTPTINAQGTVIMTIAQNISNISATGPSIGGSTAVFERTISTEVVAGDGQTVMLGGLISENKNTGATSIPVLGSLPLLGHLFRTDTEESDKTELVVLVTPRIISTRSDWEMVKNGFAKGLENIKF
ncbi:type II secretory pathway protein [Colwellia sp. D2M02]|uniref:secretin N-terminal domain-containing protein n=1 Tax=Colwellia sp. D2M02 TaxID=2841562 RepID=UPI001C09BDD0|nr:secretin N-terminal domain-containing protein [Colwellia sp. D2M02]MBU2891939.1 type II secretory pathway protein [Colwellia sp. D2M02]